MAWDEEAATLPTMLQAVQGCTTCRAAIRSGDSRGWCFKLNALAALYAHSRRACMCDVCVCAFVCACVCVRVCVYVRVYVYVCV